MAIFLAAMWNEMSFLNWFFCQPIGSVWNGTDRIGSLGSRISKPTNKTRLANCREWRPPPAPPFRFSKWHSSCMFWRTGFSFDFCTEPHTELLKTRRHSPPLIFPSLKLSFSLSTSKNFHYFKGKRGSRLWRHFLCAKRSSKWKGRQLWSNICRQDDGKWRENTYTHNTIRWREGGSAYFT